MRYIPHTESEIKEMLATCQLHNIAGLFQSIPAHLQCQQPLQVPQAMPEHDLLNHLRELANKNAALPEAHNFMGGGVYRHYIPSVVGDIMSRSEFLTPYTPYQPEISQGTLQVIFEFQTIVSEILGLPIANASTYDGSTGLVEAILMALRLKKKRRNILIPENLHPEYRSVIQTTLQGFDVNLVTIPFDQKTGAIDRSALTDFLDDNLAACVVAYPNFFGIVDDIRDIAEKVHAAGGLILSSSCEPLAFGLFESPGAMEIDIASAEGQSLGLPPNFGGPFVGLFATKKEFIRQVPGRLCGLTNDAKGKRGFVLTLSTREQHIRRERATSNICTNQALCATQFTVFMSLLGKQGYQQLAKTNWQLAEYTKKELTAAQHIEIPFAGTTFNEFVIRTPKPADLILQQLNDRGWQGGIDLGRWYPQLANAILVSVTELNNENSIDKFVQDLTTVAGN